MNLTEEERRAIVAYRLERADAAMTEAVAVAEMNFWNLSANRLYYACYYACAALLISRGLEAHTHAGVFKMIGLHFVKEGMLDLSDSKLMKRLFMMRHSGDYDDMFDWSREDVLPIVEPTRNLIAKIRSQL